MKKTFYPLTTITLFLTFKAKQRDMHDKGTRYDAYIGNKLMCSIYPPNIDVDYYGVIDLFTKNISVKKFTTEEDARKYCIRMARQFIAKLKG